MVWRGIEDYSLVARLKRLPAEHYDAGYWHGRTGPSGQDSDSGMYFGIGQALADFILNRNARVLDGGACARLLGGTERFGRADSSSTRPDTPAGASKLAG